MKDIEREFGISSAAGNFWKKVQPKGKFIRESWKISKSL